MDFFYDYHHYYMFILLRTILSINYKTEEACKKMSLERNYSIIYAIRDARTGDQGGKIRERV